MELINLIEHMTGLITILVLDFKNEFGDIPNKLGRDKWLYYDASGGFRLAWNPPAKCLDNHSWISNLTRIICPLNDLKFSEATLAAVIQIAFNILNNPIVNPVCFPSPRLIEEMLDYLPREMIATKDMYLESVRQKIRFLRRISGNLLEAERGFDIFTHLIEQKKCAVINCSKLPTIIAHLLVNILSFQYSFIKISLNEISKQTIFVMVVDEGDQFCSKEAARKFPEGYSEFGKGYKQWRAFGGMHITGLTSYDNCCPIITGNTSNFYIFKQTDPNSTTEASRTLLEPESRQFIDAQPCGQTIFKGAMDSIRYGLPVIVDYTPVKEITTPPQYDTHPYILARGIDDIPGFREALDSLIDQFRASHARSKIIKSKKIKLTKKETTFLKLISMREYKPLNLIFEEMGVTSSGVQSSIIKKLLDQKLITAVTFRSESSWFRLGWLTDKGWDFNNDSSKYPSTRGELTHTTISYNIMFLGQKRGYDESVCEKQLMGTRGFCDAFHLYKGQVHVYEVIYGTDSNVCKHARDALIESTDPVASLTFVTALKSQHKKIERTILSDPQLVFQISKIHFTTAAQIFKEVWS